MILNQQQFEARHNQLLTEKVKDCIFPAEKIPEGFSEYIKLCLPHLTHRALQCSIEEYKKVINFAYNWNIRDNADYCSLTTMVISLQLAQNCSAATLGINLAHYCEIQVHVDELAHICEAILKPYSEKVTQIINADEALERKKSSLSSGRKTLVLPN